MNGPNGLFYFFNDLRKNGLFHAMFNETPIQMGRHIVENIMNASDIAIVIACVELLFIMFGSKRATKWLYWTTAVYIIVKIIGKLVLG